MQFVEFYEIIKKRSSIEEEWYTEIEKCWEEMTGIFSADVNKTIQFLDICTADEFSWLSEVVEDIAKYFGCDIVPIVLEGTIQDGVDYVLNNRKSLVAKNGAEIEGLVGRTQIETRDRTGHRNIIKIKYKDFQ